MERGWGSAGGAEAVPGVSCTRHRDPLQSQTFRINAPGQPQGHPCKGQCQEGEPRGDAGRAHGTGNAATGDGDLGLRDSWGRVSPGRLRPTTLSTAPRLPVTAGATLQCPRLPGGLHRHR